MNKNLMTSFIEFIYVYRMEKTILKTTPFILIWVKGNSKKILRIEHQSDKENFEVIGLAEKLNEYECLKKALEWIDKQEVLHE